MGFTVSLAAGYYKPLMVVRVVLSAFLTLLYFTKYTCLIVPLKEWLDVWSLLQRKLKEIVTFKVKLQWNMNK